MGFRQDAFTYSALIAAAGNSGDRGTLQRGFDEAVQHGDANVAVCNAAIEAFGKCHDIMVGCSATRPVCETSCSALLDLCCQVSKRLDEGLQALISACFLAGCITSLSGHAGSWHQARQHHIQCSDSLGGQSAAQGLMSGVLCWTCRKG